MGLLLVLDLERCAECERCAAVCDRRAPRPGEHPIAALREDATFLLVCRRCEHANCAAACPAEALERGPDGVMVRHNLRCVSCKSCVAACPFGTVLPELVAFYSVVCDGCAAPADGAAPGCVATCTGAALEWREAASDEPDLHRLTERIAVRALRWRKREEVAA